jgi:hypothetical protein
MPTYGDASKQVDWLVLSAALFFGGFAVGVLAATVYHTGDFLNSADAAQRWSIWSSIGTCLGSFAAVIGVGVAAWSFRSQVQQSKITLGADMLFKLTETFDSSRMHEARYRASRYLQSAGRKDSGLDSNSHVNTVLDFFEQVALLERRGAIQTEFVWHAFYEWIFNYYHLTKNYRAEVRKSDPTVWADLEMLYARILARQGTDAATFPTHNELLAFVSEEQSLRPLM